MALVSRLVSGGDIDLIVSMLRCFSAAHETKPFHVIIFSDQYRTSTNQFLPLESLSLSLSLIGKHVLRTFFWRSVKQHTQVLLTLRNISHHTLLFCRFSMYISLPSGTLADTKSL